MQTSKVQVVKKYSGICIPEKRLFSAKGWAVYQLFNGRSFLWENLKLIQLNEKGDPYRHPRRGEVRTLRTAWGIDARRFARNYPYVQFVVQNPEANAALEQLCARYFTVEKLEAQWGKPAVDKERRRAAESRAKWDESRVAKVAEYMERVHAAALEEHARWRALYED